MGGGGGWRADNGRRDWGGGGPERSSGKWEQRGETHLSEGHKRPLGEGSEEKKDTVQFTAGNGSPCRMGSKGAKHAGKWVPSPSSQLT